MQGWEHQIGTVCLSVRCLLLSGSGGGHRVGPRDGGPARRRRQLNYSPAGMSACDLGRNQTRGRHPVTRAGSCDLPFNYLPPGAAAGGMCDEPL